MNLLDEQLLEKLKNGFEERQSELDMEMLGLAQGLGLKLYQEEKLEKDIKGLFQSQHSFLASVVKQLLDIMEETCKDRKNRRSTISMSRLGLREK